MLTKFFIWLTSNLTRHTTKVKFYVALLVWSSSIIFLPSNIMRLVLESVNIRYPEVAFIAGLLFMAIASYTLSMFVVWIFYASLTVWKAREFRDLWHRAFFGGAHFLHNILAALRIVKPYKQRNTARLDTEVKKDG